MDQKCVLCGADLVWDQEAQKYSCSDQCTSITPINDSGLPEAFRKHYRFLIRTVKKLRRDVAVLKMISSEVFDAYASSLAQDPQEKTVKESQEEPQKKT